MSIGLKRWPFRAALAALFAVTGCGSDDAARGGAGGGGAPSIGDEAMELALAGLPEGPGPLRAILDTEPGTITCELRPDKAPIAVANFVGLARGVKEWLDPTTREFVKRPFYDGLTFHRVIDDFVAQGGDPLGTGYGGPGYKFADEISDLKHEPGTLAYANSGPDTNGSQFYITETAQPRLDGRFTIFGSCAPTDVIQSITSTRTDRNDRPITPIHTRAVTITRAAP
jgi:peptidyl-prolyl cis-trans isomerase A (cyclophilin A)